MPKIKRLRRKPRIPSHGVEAFQGRIHAAILYPALGTPEVISAPEHLQVILLGPNILTPAMVNGRLKIFSDYDSLRHYKSGHTAKLSAPATLVKAPCGDNLVLKHLTLDANPVSVPEAGFKGLLSESYVKKLTKDADGKKVFTDLWQVTINLQALLPGWSKIMAGHKRFFLSWSSGGNQSGPELQQTVLHKILLEEMDGDQPLFLGKRLQRDMKDAVENNPLESLACFDAVKFAMDSDVLITDLHPFYVMPKDRHLTLGFISDLHLVTKFRVLRHSKLRAMPGVKEGAPAEPGQLTGADAPAIGDMVLDTADTLDELFRNAASHQSKVEALIVGGDLVDFFQDQYPSQMEARFLKANKPGSKIKDWEVIWELCGIEDDDAKRLKNYQAGTSATAFFHLIVNFVKRCEKPIFVLAGNHDGYHKPFGISPRVAAPGVNKSDKDYKELSKANDGIPADCNLTILEACLAFGSSYDIYLKIRDFNKEILNLFYLLYTPFRSVTCKLGKFQLAILDWGDDEDMFFRSGQGIGHLPHANQATSKKDLEILEYAVTDCAPRKVVLASHYTWACYDPSVPIHAGSRKQTFSVKTGILGIRTAESTVYNVGSSRLEREKIFDWFKDGKIHYCLSGHAHRAAIYGLTDVAENYDVTVAGFHFEEFDQFRESARLPFPVIIVSDSAGPIPRENNGFLDGWGSNVPSYTRLTFDTDGNLSGLRRIGYNDARAKPRLAVSLDYLEIRALLAHAKTQSMLPTKSAQNMDLHGDAVKKALKDTEKPDPTVPFNTYYDAKAVQDIKIFSALWGKPYTDKALFRAAEPKLKFHFLDDAMKLPGSAKFGESKLVLINKNTNAAIAFILERDADTHSIWVLGKGRNQKHFTWLSAELQKAKEKFQVGYLSFRFDGNAPPYSLDAPWNVRIQLHCHQQEAGNFITIFRDIRFNELPVNKNYRDEYVLLAD